MFLISAYDVSRGCCLCDGCPGDAERGGRGACLDCVWARSGLDSRIPKLAAEKYEDGGRKACLMTDLYAKHDVKTKQNMLEK